MSYDIDIFKNYFEENSDSDYLKVHRANQESYEDIFRDLLPLDKSAKVLEIGCGAGQLLYYLKTIGYTNIQGIDMGKEQTNFLKKMGIEGHLIASIPDFLKDKKELYDFIIMNQVIEHFTKSELWNNLRAIRDSLKDDGSFVFVTPNMACLSGLFQRYIDLTHEIGFTERTAYQVMRIAGFKNTVIRGDNLKLKLRPKRIMWWLLNKLWYKVLGFILYIEKGMDRPKILSRDLVVIGKKQ